MAALTTNSNLDQLVDREIREFDVAAGVRIYRGAAVGLNYSGYARGLVAPDKFVGFALGEANNSSSSTDGDTTGTAGYDGKCRVVTSGDVILTVTSVAQGDAGKAVYATNDGTFGLVGHPNCCVGFVKHKYAANKALVRIREQGEHIQPNAEGSLTIFRDFASGVPTTGDVASAGQGEGLIYGSLVGLGVLPYAASGAYTNGMAALQFDAQAEIALAYMQTAPVFNIAYGITMRAVLNLNDIGNATALDTDWGLGDVLNTTTRANMDNAAFTKGVRFHMDGNSANIMAQSIGGTTAIASTDTTIDNVTTVTTGLKTFDIILRPTGIAELYIDGSRVLSSTVFDVSTSGSFAAFFNMEKTSDATTALALIKMFSAAGSRG